MATRHARVRAPRCSTALVKLTLENAARQVEAQEQARGCVGARIVQERRVGAGALGNEVVKNLALLGIGNIAIAISESRGS